MAQHNPPDPTDYSLHTDEQLREAITKIRKQEPRVKSEDSTRPSVLLSGSAKRCSKS